MTYKDILRVKPWLQVCHIGNINSRMLKSTNGNAFVVWNNIHQQFQLHTVEAEELSGDSTNTNVDIELLNQYLINYYNCNDMKKFMYEIQDEMQVGEYLRAYRGNTQRRNMELDRQLGAIERVFGTKL